jgi:5'-nucleotidase
MTKPLILITNDDGFRSPGLWAVAEAVEDFAEVLVAAPRQQHTGAGRSMPVSSGGNLRRASVELGSRVWNGYSVEGSPAQAVQHALLELAPRPPALLIAGINYGENVGTGVTISGTVGAALEAATFGVPALAVSLETEKQYHLSHSRAIDFGVAAHFTRLFARLMLELPPQADVDALKVEVPAGATIATPWRVTRLSRQRYYHPVRPTRDDCDTEGHIDYYVAVDEHVEPDSDVYALMHDRVVSVTPISLDITSRLDLGELEGRLRWERKGEGERG